MSTVLIPDEAPAREDAAPQSPAAASMVRGVKTYGAGATEVRALDDVTVSFESGAFSAIMGPSGSGKSTLMHCLAELDDLTSGTAFVVDKNVTAMKERSRTRLRREQIGFIFQAYNLIPTPTAIENIVLPKRLAKSPWIPSGWTPWSRRSTSRIASSTRPTSCRAVSSNAWPSRVRCSAGPS